MARMVASVFFYASLVITLVAGHVSIFHPSMWGFNVTLNTFPYDNRPVAPLMHLTFENWWFHNHLDYPPNPGDVYQLAAGQSNNFEIACAKAFTSYGPNPHPADYPCPGAPVTEFHTTGLNDTKGCALAIAYNSDVGTVNPEDFAVFSVNQTCVWTRNTLFQVPQNMPSCPPGGCICAWFWIHSPDAGSEQMYMTGFRCNVTGATSTVPIAASKVARRCGADPYNGKNYAVPSNCTYGAKQPFYWDQLERNNIYESTRSPPYYNDLYNFKDGAQDDIFDDSVLPTFVSSSTGWPVTRTSQTTSTPTTAAEMTITNASSTITDSSTTASAAITEERTTLTLESSNISPAPTAGPEGSNEEHVDPKNVSEEARVDNGNRKDAPGGCMTDHSPLRRWGRVRIPPICPLRQIRSIRKRHAAKLAATSMTFPISCPRLDRARSPLAQALLNRTNRPKYENILSVSSKDIPRYRTFSWPADTTINQLWKTILWSPPAMTRSGESLIEGLEVLPAGG